MKGGVCFSLFKMKCYLMSYSNFNHTSLNALFRHNGWQNSFRLPLSLSCRSTPTLCHNNSSDLVRFLLPAVGLSCPCAGHHLSNLSWLFFLLGKQWWERGMNFTLLTELSLCIVSEVENSFFTVLYWVLSFFQPLTCIVLQNGFFDYCVFLLYSCITWIWPGYPAPPK